MSEMKDLGKAPFLILAAIISKVFGLAYFFILTRIASSSVVGLVGMSIALLSSAMNLITLPFGAVIKYFVPKKMVKSKYDEIRAVLRYCLGYPFVISLFVGVLMFLSSDLLAKWYFKEIAMATPIKALAFIIPFAVLVIPGENLIFGLKRFRVGVLFNTVPKPLQVIISLSVLFLAIQMGFSEAMQTTAILLGFFFMYLLMLLILAFSLSDFWPKVITAKVVSLKKDVKEFSKEVALTGLSNQFWSQLDYLVIGFFLTPISWAYYSIASIFVLFLQNITLAINKVSSPNFVELWEVGKKKEFSNLMEQGLRYQLLSAVPLTVMGVVSMPIVVPVLFTQSFEPAVLCSQILTVGAFFATLFSFLYTPLFALNEIKSARKAIMAFTVVNLVLNLALVGRYGVNGVAFATTFTYILLCCFAVYTIIKRIHIKWPLRSLAMSLIPALVFAVPLYLGAVNDIWVLLAYLCVFGLVYTGWLLLTKELLVRHLRMVLSFVKLR